MLYELLVSDLTPHSTCSRVSEIGLGAGANKAHSLASCPQSTLLDITTICGLTRCSGSSSVLGVTDLIQKFGGAT
jgi:hypothetical protein